MEIFDSCVRPVKDLLAEVNAANGLDLELHPAWGDSIIPDAKTENIGYKIRSASDRWRIMHLLVHPINLVALSGGSEQLTSAAKNRIAWELLQFWDGQRSTPEIVVKI